MDLSGTLRAQTWMVNPTGTGHSKVDLGHMNAGTRWVVRDAADFRTIMLDSGFSNLSPLQERASGGAQMGNLAPSQIGWETVNVIGVIRLDESLVTTS